MVDLFFRELNGVAGFTMRKQKAISGELHPVCNRNLLPYHIFRKGNPCSPIFIKPPAYIAKFSGCQYFRLFISLIYRSFWPGGCEPRGWAIARISMPRQVWYQLISSGSGSVSFAPRSTRASSDGSSGSGTLASFRTIARDLFPTSSMVLAA